MLQVVEHPEGLRDGLVRAPVAEIGHGADAARIVLKLWVVEARGPGSPESVHNREGSGPAAVGRLGSGMLAMVKAESPPRPTDFVPTAHPTEPSRARVRMSR